MKPPKLTHRDMPVTEALKLMGVDLDQEGEINVTILMRVPERRLPIRIHGVLLKRWGELRTKRGPVLTGTATYERGRFIRVVFTPSTEEEAEVRRAKIAEVRAELAAMGKDDA